MKDNPLIISLLIGLIVILVIAGVSLLVKMNVLSGVYKQELAKNISLEKNAEDLKAENSSLAGEVGQLNNTIKDLEEENIKIERLKEKLEENLKDELMKQKVVVE
ncbi:MAG: hypothetical protein KAS05_03685 [Candidatus Omnitrophica bacterium]|nr:hypothetical protein [Candidatus Omnitrophota bacterium]